MLVLTQKLSLYTCSECKERVHLKPVCVLSDVTTGHLESAAKKCIFEKIQWHSTKCGISNFFFLYFALWIWRFRAACIILIQAIGVFISFILCMYLFCVCIYFISHKIMLIWWRNTIIHSNISTYITVSNIQYSGYLLVKINIYTQTTT